MRTFTFRHRDDTIIERDGRSIRFTFYPDTFTYEAPDTMEFNVTQDELLQMIVDYSESGKHADLFDQLTLLGQDALLNALICMRDRSITL